MTDADPGPGTERGTFLVTHADEGSAVLRDVATARVYTLSAHPDPVLAPGEVVTATLAPGAMGVTWTVADVADRREVTAERGSEPPAGGAVAALDGQEPGTAVELDADDVDSDASPGGDDALAVHALAVPPGETEAAATDAVEDEATLVRAARLGAARVEVRGADGVLTLRYLE